MKYLLNYLLLLFILLSFVGVTSGTSLYVNETGWYRSGAAFNASVIPIQHAVDNATTIDTVYVWNGSYSDNIIISTAYLTIQGESKDTVEIVAATNLLPVIKINDNTDYVNISDINVSGADGNQMCGILYRLGADHGNVSNCIAYNNYYGVHLQNSSNSLVDDCMLLNNSLHGVLLNTVTRSNIITNNIIKFNGYYGISLYESNHTIIQNNTVYKSNFAGIHVEGVNNTIDDNNVSETTEDGIYLNGGNNNIVKNNKIYVNGKYGIHSKNSDNINISNNTISSNSLGGIIIETSDNGNLTDNYIHDNTRHGIYIYSSDDTFLYLNSIVDTSGGYYDYYLNPTSYRTIFRNLADTHNNISIGDAASNCTVEFTDRTIFKVNDISKYVEYYTNVSNLSLQGAAVYRIDKYNGTLTPQTTFLQNVSVNTWGESGYNVTVNSSNATEICTFTVNVANASDNYGCYVDGVLNETIPAIDSVVTWKYIYGFSEHDLKIKWDSLETYSSDEPENVFNKLITTITGFIGIMGSILTLFLSFLPLFVGVLIFGFVMALLLGLFKAVGATFGKMGK